MRAQAPLRIGVVAYLLNRPLIRGLQSDPDPRVELLGDVPARVGEGLLAGRLDAALTPVATILAHPELTPLAGVGVACDGAVMSIRLFHSKPLAEVRSVALDTSSRSSVRLTRIALERYEGLRPTYLDMPPDLDAMLEAADAALLIGDPALRAPQDAVPWIDMGEYWKRRTGLGFVFAQWAFRAGISQEAQTVLASKLLASLDAGEAELESIIREESVTTGMPPEVVRPYLSNAIRYRLTQSTNEGMRLFEREARAMGLLEPGGARPRSPGNAAGATGRSPEVQAGPPQPGAAGLHKRAILDLFREDLLSLGQAADDLRFHLHPDPIVTYVADRNINYTNICESRCRFCAFWRAADAPDAYVLRVDEVLRKVGELVDAGGTQVLMQGGLNPALDLAWTERLLTAIRDAYPSVDLHSLSPPEVVHLARLEGLPLRTVLARLRDAGLSSLPGGGAEVLSDRVRALVSPAKCTADEWITVMREAHGLGLRSTATMMFGHLDAPEDLADHFSRVRDLQEETGGFTAFIPWTFQAAHTDLADVPAAGGHAYLKVLAISRLALPNVPHVQASWVTQGAKVAQIALRFGADDVGGTMMEENVVAAAGCRFRMDAADLRRLAEEAGFALRQRRTDYSPL